MRMTIPSNSKDEDAEISGFFGMSKYFFIYEVDKGGPRLLEVRENRESRVLQQLDHSKRAPAVQRMIDGLLNDCHVFVAVGMNGWVVENLTARGRKVRFVQEGKIGELADRFAKGELE
jgi:predicted Fe-Mo cluster-binding NifX family protein